MIKLFRKAVCQAGEPNTERYHLAEYSAIGNEKYGSALKESGITTVIGETRKRRIAADIKATNRKCRRNVSTSMSITDLQ
jgi:hypothetical protein